MNIKEQLHTAEVLVRHAGKHKSEGQRNLAGQKTARATEILASLDPKELARQDEELLAVAVLLTQDCAEMCQWLEDTDPNKVKRNPHPSHRHRQKRN